LNSMNKLSRFFSQCPTPSQALDKTDSEDMIRLMMSPDMDEPMTYQEFLAHPRISSTPKAEIPTALMAVWLRSLRLNDHFKMSLSAAMFLSLFVRSFGDATLYFSYAAYKAKTLGYRNITLDFLSKNVFPWGVFTEDDLKAMWGKQKDDDSPNQNLLDNGQEWKLYLYGEESSDKVLVRFSEDEEKPLSFEELDAMGEINEPQVVEGRMYFWLGKRYVSVSFEDYEKLENK